MYFLLYANKLNLGFCISSLVSVFHFNSTDSLKTHFVIAPCSCGHNRKHAEV